MKIRNKEEHEAVRRVIGMLMDADRDTAAGYALDYLCDIIKAYEDEHYPIAKPAEEPR